MRILQLKASVQTVIFYKGYFYQWRGSPLANVYSGVELPGIFLFSVFLPLCVRVQYTLYGVPVHQYAHRRRMETEAKAKVVPSVWGADIVQFLAALAVLPRSVWKKRFNSSSIDPIL